MSGTLRIWLIIAALVLFAIVCVAIRRERIRVADSAFWVVFSLVIILFALFPQVAYWLAGIVGVQSPSNLVFAVIIAILILIDVASSAKISRLTAKLEKLSSNMALNEDDED